MKKGVFILTLLLGMGCSMGVNDVALMLEEPTHGMNDRYRDYGENPFLSVEEYPVSTFSVDADGASYANVRRFVLSGTQVPPAAVRLEDFINYFTYDYPEPETGENISLETELTTCPWDATHHLIRIGMKGRNIAEADLPASNFVFLIDVSGSMNTADRLETLKAGFIQMVDALRPIDRVAIVTYAGKAGVSLPSTPCTQKDKIKRELEKLGTKGATAGMAGIVKAYEIAMENYIPQGNNRIILATDGDFNVGISSTEELVAFIRQKRNSGIFLTVLGVGRGNLNDEMIERLANHGNGNYEYIGSAAQVRKVFVDERLKFYTVAKDTKVQLTFNPGRVSAYRLIGYENRLMEEPDFDDDDADAGEIGVNQCVTALYEVVLAGEAPGGNYAQLSVRYKKDLQAVSRELKSAIVGEPVAMEQASESSRFVAAVTGAGLLFKNSLYKGGLNWTMVTELAEGATRFDPHGYRADFCHLCELMVNRK